MYVAGLFELLEQRRAGCWFEGEYAAIWGYSDDNWAMAPSLTALQDMIETMEEYASSHNLKFSTDPDPRKCKTKCMAYLRKPRELPSMMLCGIPLPWVDSIKHLGITVTNKVDGCQQDVMTKRARYIQRCSEVLQEFHFVNKDVKMSLHMIYNSHFSGSPCWDMSSRAFHMIEATFNRNIKITYELPYQTHINLLPVLSSVKPLRVLLSRRLLTFVDSIRKLTKVVIKNILRLVEPDVRTVTGRNLRNTLMMTDISCIELLRPADLDDVSYYGEPDLWRVLCLTDILMMRAGQMDLPPGWKKEEIEAMLESACCD